MQLPWEIPWTEEGYSSWGSKRVRHELATEQQQIFIYKLTSLRFSLTQ